ncbi:hypothetical protein ACOMHN_062890 [Nucella lapillus]
MVCGQTTVAAGSILLYFLAWRLTSSCSSRLSSKGLGADVVCQTPSAPVRCKMLPVYNRDAASMQRVFEGVRISLDLAPLSASAPSQFGAEDLHWKTAVLHPHHVTGPSQLSIYDNSLDA